MKKENGFIKGALILSIGAFVAKLLGAIYRVPLTKILGSYGIGLYQMVFPVYTLLLDFSGAGAPNAIAKLIAEKEEEKLGYSHLVLKVSKKLLVKIGLIFSLIMLCFSFLISKGQGNSSATIGYIFLSPSILLVCVLSCYRGYFQGLMNMTPTTVSQILEQIIKLIFGITLTFLFRNNLIFAVGMATLSITISELIAFVYFYVLYKKRKIKNEGFIIDKGEEKEIKSSLIKYLIPISIIGLLIPLSHVIDSFTIVNVISRYREDATSLFGISSGIVHTVINLPVALCYSISTVSVPYLSKAKTIEDKNKKASITLLLTLLVSIPLALLTAIFSNSIIKILFKGLLLEEKEIASLLLKITSINVVFLSFLQTQNGVLVGKGKLYAPTISMGIGIVIKTILTIILTNIHSLNIYGSGIAVITCYFISILINLIWIYGLRIKNGNKRTLYRQTQS